MKISTKIYGGFGLMMVIMLIIVGTFYYQYQMIEKATDDVTQYRIPMRDKAQAVALGASREAAAIRGYLATGNPKFKQDLEKAVQEVEENLKYLNENARNKQFVKPVNEASGKFQPHLKKMIELYETQGQTAGAAYMAAYAAPDNAAFLAELDKYLERQMKLTNDELKKIDEQQSKMVTTIAIILGIGLLLGGVSAVLIARPILASINQGVDYARAMAQGILDQQIEVRTNDEMGMLLDNLNKASASLRSLAKQVANSAEAVAASSEELTASAEQSAQAANQVAATITHVAQGAETQVHAVNTTAAVVEQMSAGIQQIAANASAMTGVSEKTASSAHAGGKTVHAAINQMNSIEQSVSASAQVVAKLGERSKEIGQIVDAISAIAGQTNLLALNAAIEAARAGEQGRGFAVVAEEVRKLAEQSQEAAKQIANLINEIQAETDNAVVAMNNGVREVKAGAGVVNTAGTAFMAIVTLIDEMSGQVREISAAIQQMASSSQQIVAAVRDIDRITKDTAAEAQTVSAATEEQSASMEEIAAASQALAKMAEELQGVVSKFRI